jgi:hypothetical protein
MLPVPAPVLMPNFEEAESTRLLREAEVMEELLAGEDDEQLIFRLSMQDSYMPIPWNLAEYLR